ncbi:MAG TPA: restriction endonuclease subunit S [Anaerolineae bacterium]|nr:restriction endonuclease subunit S [Anaerolineae bacterium]
MSEINLPTGWTQVKFGDVAKQIKTKVDPETSDLERYIAGGHMDTDDLKLRRWGTIGDGYLGPAFHRMFKKGQILYGSRRTYLRKVAVADFDGVCANTTFVIEAKAERIHPPLLPFIMQSEPFVEHSIKNSRGSTNPYVNWKDIAKYEFPLPPLDEQRRIAGILWAVEEVIESQILLKNKLEKIMRLMRYHCFSQDWREESLENLFHVQLGKMLSKKARQGKSPKPYLANANVQWNYIDLSEVRQMDFDDKEFKKFKLEVGDILVCEGGEVGRSAIWEGQIENCCYQKALHRLRNKNNELHTKLMLHFMNYANRKGYFAALTGHSTIAHLTMVKLKKLKVPVPPPNVQLHMLNIFNQLEITTKVALDKLEKTFKLKKSLLEQLL